MPTIEERLKRLEDIEEIRALFVEYGRALDSRDLHAYSLLFARDSEWSGGLGSAKTPEGIRTMLEKAIGGMPKNYYGNTNHIMSNMLAEIDGDTARVWSRWTWFVSGEEGRPVPMRAGHYDDVLVREGGRWRFKSRRAVTEQTEQKR